MSRNDDLNNLRQEAFRLWNKIMSDMDTYARLNQAMGEIQEAIRRDKLADRPGHERMRNFEAL